MAYQENNNGSYVITEQGDLGLGLTPIAEGYKEEKKEQPKEDKEKK